MKDFFSKYSRFLGMIFFVWLCLKIAKIFNFDFAVDLSFFFWVFLFLSFPLIVWWIKKNWNKICQIIRNTNLKIRKIFLGKTKSIQDLHRFQIQSGMIKERKLEKSGPTGKFINTGFIIFIIRFFLKNWILSKKTFLLIVLLGLFFDIFVFHSTSDLLILFLAGLWIWSIRIFKFNGRVSIIFALVFLLMRPFLLILDKELIAEKSAIWAYMFLVMGVIQEFIKSMKENRNAVEIR